MTLTRFCGACCGIVAIAAAMLVARVTVTAPEQPEPPRVTGTRPVPIPADPTSERDMANYLATGSPDPDCTGVFAQAGAYGGQPYFQNGDWFVWWYSDTWVISGEVGVEPSVYWVGGGEPPDASGAYAPGAGVSGEVTLGEHSGPPGLPPFGPYVESSRNSEGGAGVASKPVDTAITIVLGPCIDDEDFKSREEELTYDQAGMEIDVILEETDGTISVTAVTPTESGDYDWTHLDQGYYSLELPASGGASYNNDTLGILYAVGYCTGVLPFRSPVYSIVPKAIYEMNAKGSGIVAGAVDDADPSSLSFDTDLTEATDDHYVGGIVVFTSGALAKQARRISDYDGTGKTISVLPAFTEAPATTDTFVILGRIEHGS
jgi:hypothetical protein